MICGDGSGGEYASDFRYRGCGWSWTVVGGSEQSLDVQGSCHGPLAGARQTSNRAELCTLIHAASNTRGYITFWTDSLITLRGWRARRHLGAGYTSTNADLWGRLCKALDGRGGPDDMIDVWHIDSHQTQ